MRLGDVVEFEPPSSPGDLTRKGGSVPDEDFTTEVLGAACKAGSVIEPFLRDCWSNSSGASVGECLVDDG